MVHTQILIAATQVEAPEQGRWQCFTDSLNQS